MCKPLPMTRFLIIFLIIGFQACLTSHNSQIHTTRCDEKSFIKVKYSDLIHYKANYHKKYVEVGGYFKYGFEMFKIQFDTATFSWDKNSDYKSYYSNIWIEFGSSNLYKGLDTLKGKHVLVKGLYDTSKYGHNEAYFAEILDVCEIKQSTSADN